MQNAEKVEIGYTLPKERWQEAAKNLEDLGQRAGRQPPGAQQRRTGRRGRGRTYGGYYAGLYGAPSCGGVRNG